MNGYGTLREAPSGAGGRRLVVVPVIVRLVVLR